MLLAKVALGVGSTLCLAGAYAFHEGVVRVDVDDHVHRGGQHVHVWLPAAVVPLAMHIMPRPYLEQGASQVGPWMPTLRALTKELAKYPDAELVTVEDSEETVHVLTRGGKLLIDVEDGDQTVHVVCPLSMMRDIADELERNAPGA
jgi:hypothetical protein